MEIYADQVKGTRKVMSLPLLKMLGNEIAKTMWDENSKQVVWSALTLAFFGSFRMGEILSPQENSFSPKDTLLWKDVKFLSPSHIIVHIKTPKSRLPDGEFVDIFEFGGHNVCPVKALARLRDSTHVAQDSPVFQFSNGKFLTLGKVNSILPQLLAPHLGLIQATSQDTALERQSRPSWPSIQMLQEHLTLWDGEGGSQRLTCPTRG